METPLGRIMGLDYLSPTPEPVEITVPVLGEAGNIIPISADITDAKWRKLRVHIGAAAREVALSLWPLDAEGGVPIPFQIEDHSGAPDPSPNSANRRHVLAGPVEQIIFRRNAERPPIWSVDAVATPDNQESLKRFADRVGKSASSKQRKLAGEQNTGQNGLA